ncbi:MATE family efflux transporter [Paenibacillus sp. JX-17]|uniref:Probable multidrug resistance protein NorM n=1 Tax=Paenibacillus lacisoli TaxID=3064525 RepID=A0ABT9CFW1_9BACL|nr:MATE family efflux transporter [Paenibacillus sp. JX-17]MDO7908165.1 MATE family efflux transporter [Paenibacillus sp. JX-17]
MSQPALGVQKSKTSFLDKYFSGESVQYQQIIALFIPLLIDQAFLIGLSLVNTAMISSAGMDAISAVNMIDSLNNFLVSVFLAVATGGTVVVAQYKGNGNPLMVSRAAAGTVSSVSLFALAISALMILFYSPILNMLFGTASPDVMSNGKIYLLGSCISYVGIAMIEAVCGALRGIGKTRASLGLSLVMHLSYVVLNAVFIYLLHMGVLGMSIALNISRYAGAIVAVIYLIRVDDELRFQLRDLFQVQWSMFKKIMFIGLPFAAEQMFFNGGKIVTQIFIVSLGTYAIATNAIGGTLAGLTQIPAQALSLTLVTVVGQCIGRGNVKDARKLTRSFLWLSSFIFVLTGLVTMLLFYPLVSLFSPPQEIVDDIFLVILINCIAQIPLWSIAFLAPSALRAAGDSKFTSMTSMLSMWLFRIVLGYILGIVFKMGIIGVWLAMDIEWGVRGIVFWWRLRGKKWYQHRLID